MIIDERKPIRRAATNRAVPKFAATVGVLVIAGSLALTSCSVTTRSEGHVDAVSSTSITVSVGDGDSETYPIDSKTKISTEPEGKGKPLSISQVRRGDHVQVSGSGTRHHTTIWIADYDAPR